jgi:hypothetical protein
MVPSRQVRAGQREGQGSRMTPGEVILLVAVVLLLWDDFFGGTKE